MKNADMPAMPIVDSCARPAMYGNEGVEAIWLTKREMMAMHTLSGLIASGYDATFESSAKCAIGYADALLAELERTK